MGKQKGKGRDRGGMIQGARPTGGSIITRLPLPFLGEKEKQRHWRRLKKKARQIGRGAKREIKTKAEILRT